MGSGVVLHGGCSERLWRPHLGKGAWELLDASGGAGGLDYVMWLPGKGGHHLPLGMAQLAWLPGAQLNLFSLFFPQKTILVLGSHQPEG